VFVTLKIEQLQELIEFYVHSYYRELRKQIGRYETAGVRFPEYMVGPKRALAVITDGGVVLTHWPSEHDAFEFQVRRGSASDLLNELSGHRFRFDLDGPGRWVPDISILSVECTAVSEADQREVLVFRAPWHKLELASTQDPFRWSGQKATEEANDSVAFCVTGHLMELNNRPPNEVLEKLAARIQEFERLLGSASREELLKQFLVINPVLLDPTGVQVTREVALGSEHKVDLAIKHVDSDYTLVELEKQAHALFTQKGDPTKELSHAIRQAEDWRQWIHDNLAYAQNKLPGVNEPRCWVVIGRDSSMNPKQRRSLQRKNAEQHHIRIMTYDELLQRSKQHLRNLQ